MADYQHKHSHLPVVDAVDDPVIPDTYTVAIGCAGKLARAMWSRIVGQRFDSIIQTLLELGISEPQQKPRGSPLERNRVFHANSSSPFSFL